MRTLKSILLVLGLFPALPAVAQTPGFDPDAPCGQALRRADDTDKLMIAAWLHGFRTATGEASGPVDLAAAQSLLGGLFTDCLRDETRSLNALMLAARPSRATAAPAAAAVPATPATPAAAPQDGAGSYADAEKLLTRFLAPAADRVALTARLKPTPEDIAAVYAEPLASKLVAMYAQTFAPGVQIGPKPDQNALLIYHTTTAALKSGDEMLSKFPGGYNDVLQYFIGNQPIVRFKFVTAGEELGLAFDGLVYVNGHWALMPKPWRALD